MKDETFSTNQPSHLYHLEPIGIGTPFVESLTSYIKRLAEAHCVSPGNLLRKEIFPNINRYLNVHNFIGFDSKNIISIDSYISEAIVGILEEKTYNYDLKCLTMSTWKECLRSTNLFRKNQAWCPICYEESRRLKQPIYEHLLWNFKDVDICGKHHVKLIQKCPYCNNEFSTFNSLSRVGYCDKCNSWLGSINYQNTNISLSNEEWNSWIFDNVGQLLAVAPKIKGVSNLQFSKNLISINDSNNLSQRSFANKTNVSRDAIRGWISGYRPSLFDVLDLSFKLGYSIYDIFTKDINTLNKVLSNRSAIIKKKNNNNNFEMNEMKKVLDEAINSNKGISLSKLSKYYGTKRETIIKYFPDEAARLKESYNEYLHDCKFDRLRSIKVTIKLLFNKGIFPSGYAIEREVGKRIVQSTDEKKVWLETLEELGCTSEDYHNHYGNRKTYDSLFELREKF